MKLSKETEKKIVNKINELFVTVRYKYLTLSQQGKYSTPNIYDYDYYKKLHDGHILDHIRGNKTIGVFSGQLVTKFICFDVDKIYDGNGEQVNQKWIIYKLINALIDTGIPSQYIHTSFSGGKGYHIEIYFSDPVSTNKTHFLYNYILSNYNFYDIHSAINQQIEYRPTNTQGVKLPLGKNFTNKDNKKNTCYYCDSNLKLIRGYKHILNIKQFCSECFNNIIERLKDNLNIEQSDNIKINEAEAVKIEEDKGFIDSKYNPLSAYELNTNEAVTIEYIEQIEKNGLQQVGTRNKALFNLARYYKHLGYNSKEIEQILTEWMNRQDKRTYKTNLETCYKEIKYLSEYVHRKDIQLIIQRDQLIITYNEMLEIMKLKSKNEKLVAYALLIHCKRYANNENVFYMSFPQLEQVTGLDLRTAKRIIPKLENVIFEYIEKDKMILNNKGQFISKKPNKYKLLIIHNEDKSNYYTFNDSLDYTVNYTDCMTSLFNDSQLRVHLTKHQYYEFRNSAFLH